MRILLFFAAVLLLSCSGDKCLQTTGPIKIHELNWPPHMYCFDSTCEVAFGVENFDATNTSKIDSLTNWVCAHYSKDIAKSKKFYLIHFLRYDTLLKCGVSENSNWEQDDEAWTNEDQLCVYEWSYGEFDSIYVKKNGQLTSYPIQCDCLK